MSACKSDITISIRVGEKSFSIGGVLLPDGRYKIKRGRSWSEKCPTATRSEIFELARKWAVKQGARVVGIPGLQAGEDVKPTD